MIKELMSQFEDNFKTLKDEESELDQEIEETFDFKKIERVRILTDFELDRLIERGINA